DHDETGAAGRKLAGVHQVPVGRKALHRRILMHRRHHDAVLERDVAERHRLKQHRSAHARASSFGGAASRYRPPRKPERRNSLSLRSKAMQIWDGERARDAIAKDQPTTADISGETP